MSIELSIRTRQVVERNTLKAIDLINNGHYAEAIKLHIDSILVQDIALHQLEDQYLRLQKFSDGRKSGNDELDEVEQFVESFVVHLGDNLDSKSSITSPFLEDIKRRIDAANDVQGKARIAPFNTYLLYGVPGTGKTYMALQAAKYAKSKMSCTFFSLSAADLLNKYQGVSEKTFIMLFRKARSCHSAIIFIDEADDLLGDTATEGLGTTQRLKNKFLTEVDGVRGGSSHGGNVIIIAATNKPWALPNSVFSRFQKRYAVDLPTALQRSDLMSYEVSKARHHLTTSDFKKLSKVTEGFSPRDIKLLVQQAFWDGYVLHSNLNKQSKSNVTKRSAGIGAGKAIHKAAIYQALLIIKASVTSSELKKISEFKDGKEVEMSNQVN